MMPHRAMKASNPIILLFISLFLLASCGGAAPAEPEATITPESDPAAAAEPVAEPAGSESVATAGAVQPAESAAPQWSADPTQNVTVTNLGGAQALPQIVTTDSGDFFVAWFSNTDGSNYNVHMQKYDAGAMLCGGKMAASSATKNPTPGSATISLPGIMAAI